MDLITYAAARAYTDEKIAEGGGGGGLPPIEESDYGKVLTATADGWKANALPTNVSSFNNDAGYLTLATLPIYDGTVQNGGAG